MNLNTVDFEELLRIGAGKEVYRGEEGCILLEDDDGFCTVMSDILDGETLLKRLHALRLPPFSLATVKSKEAYLALAREYGFYGCNPCTQWVYCLPEPPQYLACDIRPLTMQYAQTAGEQYHQNFDYVRDRISAGKMWGIFENGELAGFIGIHSEGAMGMLEIYPAYRRRGYGYALSAFLIGCQLKNGAVPYCHVIDGNDASIHLQHKLGMRKADLPAIWCWKENKDVVQMT